MATDAGEQAGQAAPKGGGGGDDANGDEGSDQTILNRSRTGLVGSEAGYDVHFRIPCVML
jgi:hypothetical protein